MVLRSLIKSLDRFPGWSVANRCELRHDVLQSIDLCSIGFENLLEALYVF